MAAPSGGLQRGEQGCGGSRAVVTNRWMLLCLFGHELRGAASSCCQCGCWSTAKTAAGFAGKPAVLTASASCCSSVGGPASCAACVTADLAATCVWVLLIVPVG